MMRRLVFLLRFCLVTVMVFIAAKVVFMFYNHAVHDFSCADVLAVIGHGVSLDLSTSLYVLIFPFLTAVASMWIRLPRWLFTGYYLLVAIAFALAFVADTSLYPFWGFKLDASCLQYLETPTEAMASVSMGYLLVRLLVWVVLSLLIYLAYWLFVKTPVPYRASWKEGVLYVLAVPLLIVGIRGGVHESTTNIGQVYYSQNQFLNHSAVNPVFSFLASLEKTANNVPDYQFMDEARCDSLISCYFPPKSIDVDTLLRVQRPDIVVVLLESCGGIFTRLEGCHDVMPRLNQLMDEGVSFDSCYANSWRTDRGTVCAYSGYPSFPVSSVMKMPSKTRLLPGLAKTLAQEGYNTHYVYGGDINFTNMRSYLLSTGWQQLTWKNDYNAKEQITAEWGVRDDITFQTVAQLIQQPRNGPLLIGFSTLSSHEPWDVPIKVYDDEVLNAFHYLDQCIAQFVDNLRKTPAWDNLLLVLLPDHGISYSNAIIGNITQQDRRHNHIPMVWAGGAIKTPRHINTICNQTDLVATLLGQMGLCHDDFRYSRDVMSSNYTEHFAVHTFNNGISMIDSTGFAVFDLDARKILVNESDDAERLMQKGKAVLQSACKDLKNLHQE